jgi:hypothetical protein
MADKKGADGEGLSLEDCIAQIEDVIKQYDRMIKRLREAGKLPRNPKEREKVRARVSALGRVLVSPSSPRPCNSFVRGGGVK